jgi:hypothetical protein
VNEKTTNAIVGWWVNLLDDQDLAQDGGDGIIGAIADWSRSKATLTQKDRQKFIDQLTEFLAGWNEEEELHLYVDYEPEGFLAGIVKGNKIKLPIKTSMKYLPSGEIFGRTGYNGKVQKII